MLTNISNLHYYNNNIDMEIIKINIIEVASELADIKVQEFFQYVDEEIFKSDLNEITYTEDAQDLFNDYYDEYLTLLTNLQIN